MLIKQLAQVYSNKINKKIVYVGKIYYAQLYSMKLSVSNFN